MGYMFIRKKLFLMYLRKFFPRKICKSKPDLRSIQWTYKSIPCPRQTDGVSCAVYVIKFFDEIIKTIFLNEIKLKNSDDSSKLKQHQIAIVLHVVKMIVHMLKVYLQISI
jgi:hypothetical protein